MQPTETEIDLYVLTSQPHTQLNIKTLQEYINRPVMRTSYYQCQWGRVFFWSICCLWSVNWWVQELDEQISYICLLTWLKKVLADVTEFLYLVKCLSSYPIDFHEIHVPQRMNPYDFGDSDFSSCATSRSKC